MLWVFALMTVPGEGLHLFVDAHHGGGHACCRPWRAVWGSAEATQGGAGTGCFGGSCEHSVGTLDFRGSDVRVAAAARPGAGADEHACPICRFLAQPAVDTTYLPVSVATAGLPLLSTFPAGRIPRIASAVYASRAPPTCT